jgi:Protein of unknown function (DUF2911)
MKLRLATLAAAFAVAGLVFAAEHPRGNATANVGGKKVSIDYGRPELGGRSIDELTSKLPADRMWRAGENQVTTLTTEGDIMVGGKKVPAGKYSLYVHAPATGDWSLAINSDQGIALGKIYSAAPDDMKNAPWPRLDGYEKNIAASEVARAPMKGGKTAAPVDSFTIELKPKGDAATMVLAWGDRTWSVDVTPAK